MNTFYAYLNHCVKITDFDMAVPFYMLFTLSYLSIGKHVGYISNYNTSSVTGFKKSYL